MLQEASNSSVAGPSSWLKVAVSNLRHRLGTAAKGACGNSDDHLHISPGIASLIPHPSPTTDHKEQSRDVSSV
jgi:hypothetical protein